MDCGGGACPAGAAAKSCSAATDCASGVCTAGICQAATCTDTVKNGKETDVDCGGGTCAKCAGNKGCSSNADCVSGMCKNNKCATVISKSVTLTIIASPCSGKTGTKELTLPATTGFKVGQAVLIHQTQGTGAGTYEEGEVAAVGTTKLTLVKALSKTYTSGTGNSHAQVVVFPEYANLVIAKGATVTAPAWNGKIGGILPLKVAGELEVASGAKLSMTGRGFKGYFHKGIYRNQHGWQGESSLGPGVQKTTPNGSGGSGGYQIKGKNGSGGGGGGHAAAGGNSNKNGYGVKGVSGGAAVGKADLTTMVFGGAGGEGSADEDGYQAGGGGYSGGIVYIRAASVKINGIIEAGGGKGGNGTNSCSGCGGAGMSGGGGGAGGSVYLLTKTATLGSNVLTAAGGSKGSGNESNHGGNGSVGRIRLDFATLNGAAHGSTNATTALKNGTAPDAHGGKAQ